jgi:hypothetical protein
MASKKKKVTQEETAIKKIGSRRNFANANSSENFKLISFPIMNI